MSDLDTLPTPTRKRRGPASTGCQQALTAHLDFIQHPETFLWVQEVIGLEPIAQDKAKPRLLRFIYGEMRTYMTNFTRVVFFSAQGGILASGPGGGGGVQGPRAGLGVHVRVFRSFTAHLWFSLVGKQADLGSRCCSNWFGFPLLHQKMQTWWLKTLEVPYIIWPIIYALASVAWLKCPITKRLGVQSPVHTCTGGN